LAAENKYADLLLGNNVLAQVRTLTVLSRNEDPAQAARRHHDGVPHLLRLMEQRQFDTIYHEHFSYFSFFTPSESLPRTD